MKIEFVASASAAEVLAVLVHEGRSFHGNGADLDTAASGALTRAMNASRFTGGSNSTLVVTTVLQPWAQRQARAEAFAVRTDLAALLVEEGRFVEGPEGLTVYVQQIEQNGLLKNIFIYQAGDDRVTTWDAAEARFSRIDGEPILTLIDGSWQRYSSRDWTSRS